MTRKGGDGGARQTKNTVSVVGVYPPPFYLGDFRAQKSKPPSKRGTCSQTQTSDLISSVSISPFPRKTTCQIWANLDIALPPGWMHPHPSPVLIERTVGKQIWGPWLCEPYECTAELAPSPLAEGSWWRPISL